MAFAKQWKYRVLYVDHRGPTNSGMIGRCFRNAFCSSVAIFRCFLGANVTFHWLSSDVADASLKCSQLPVADASWPFGMNAFCERFA